MKLEGTTVLVTGASSGIGAATALELAAHGAELVLIARTESKLNAVADDIRAAGCTAHVYPCDLSDPIAVAATAERIKAEVGIPEVVVNNAGAGRWLAVEETDATDVVSMMAAPYFAAFFVTRAFVNEMRERGSGRIANVNSPMAYLVIPGATGYAASRAALRCFNDALAAELHGTGVGVSHFVFGEVASDYFTNNPGSHERMPAIGKMLPVLTPQRTARYIVLGLQRDATLLVRPLSMKAMLAFNRWMPGVMGWVARTTGWRRAKQLKS